MPYLTHKLTRAALLAVTLAACASGSSQKVPEPGSGVGAAPGSDQSLIR